MTIAEIKEKILTDDAFVLSEISRLQYLYKLKRVTRYHLDRAEHDLTESVAEHVCGMHILTQYFSLLEPGCEQLDQNKISRLILFHDTDEIEVGDMSTNLKTDAHREQERQVMPQVIAQCPDLFQPIMQELDQEYDNQTSTEARFVKAIDRLEGLIHSFHERQKPVFQHLQFTESDQVRTKKEFIEPFPMMYRFYEVLSSEFKNRGFFYDPS